jgi:hypothetical protein
VRNEVGMMMKYTITGFKAVDSRPGSQYEQIFDSPESAKVFIDDRIKGFNLNAEIEWSFIRIEPVWQSCLEVLE